LRGWLLRSWLLRIWRCSYDRFLLQLLGRCRLPPRRLPLLGLRGLLSCCTQFLCSGRFLRWCSVLFRFCRFLCCCLGLFRFCSFLSRCAGLLRFCSFLRCRFPICHHNLPDSNVCCLHQRTHNPLDMSFASANSNCATVKGSATRGLMGTCQWRTAVWLHVRTTGRAEKAQRFS